jgi:tetratricopeptide (TPR) repeat protein
MSKKLKVFISSKMHELADERRALVNLLPDLSDGSFQIEAWVFEADAQASSKSIRQVYLDALEQSDLYIGIFWQGYGEWTIDEFYRADEIGIPRHLYVKNVDTDKRDPRLESFLEKESDVRFGITPRWYQDLEDFKQQISRSVQLWQQNQSLAYHSSINAIIATLADDIPDLPRRLIGRKRLINRVADLLADNERILLRGFGGTGKTALATTIAADFIDEGLGDVIWIKVGTADADAVYEAIGRAFEQQAEILAAEGDAREHLVRRILARHKGLLVLDDVWNGSTLARITNILPRRMPLLATSRQKYPLDEVVEVGELDFDEALKLLEYHTRKDLASEVEIEQLCETLGYHAFALEIAGKTLKVYDISPSELLHRIEKAPHDLTVPAGFGELGRKGIKSLLDASIDALNRELYDTYITFGGMFEPTASANLISRVMQTEESQTQSALQELEQRGLVNERVSEGIYYYQVHDLAYSYARTTFTSKGLSYEPVIAACHDYAIDYLSELPRLDIEISNLLEAAETALGQLDSATFLSIMSALAVDGPYFAARGHSSRTLSLMRSAIEQAEKTEALETAHYLWSKLGNAYDSLLGQLKLALNAYQHALERARDLGNYQREAILLTVIGTVRFRQDASDSDDYHQQAEAIARQHNDPVVLSQVLHNRGAQALLKDHNAYDPAKGRDLSAEAAAIAKEQGLSALYFSSLSNQGAGENYLGDYEKALQTHSTAYDFAKSEGNYYRMGEAIYSMAEDYHGLNERLNAQTCFNQALNFFKECGASQLLETVQIFMEEHDYDISS